MSNYKTGFAELILREGKREWVGLTDEEIEEAAESFTEYEGFIHGVVWAESKLKEKNT